MEALSEDDENDDSGKGKMMGGMKKKKKSISKSSTKFDSYTCGCCDPVLEGDGYPSFCGGQICADDPTPCGHGRFLKKKKKSKKNSTGMMKKKTADSKEVDETPLGGVTICVDGETICVDDMDHVYLGMDAPAYTCGPC